MNAEVIGVFRHNNRGCSFIAKLTNRIIIRDRGTLPIFHLNKNVFGVGIVHNDVDFFPALSTLRA